MEKTFPRSPGTSFVKTSASCGAPKVSERKTQALGQGRGGPGFGGLKRLESRNPPFPLLPAHHQIKSACRGLSVSMSGGRRINDKVQRTSSTSSISPSREEIKPFQPNSTRQSKVTLQPHNPPPHPAPATPPRPLLPAPPLRQQSSCRAEKRWSLEKQEVVGVGRPSPCRGSWTSGSQLPESQDPHVLPYHKAAAPFITYTALKIFTQK